MYIAGFPMLCCMVFTKNKFNHNNYTYHNIAIQQYYV